MDDSILVIGGGIAGMTVAVEAAECGKKVYLVEKEVLSLVAAIVRMNKYFPKLCPPLCGAEINFRRIRSNPNVQIMTNSTVESIDGVKGNFTATDQNLSPICQRTVYRLR